MQTLSKSGQKSSNFTSVFLWANTFVILLNYKVNEVNNTFTLVVLHPALIKDMTKTKSVAKSSNWFILKKGLRHRWAETLRPRRTWKKLWWMTDESLVMKQKLILRQLTRSRTPYKSQSSQTRSTIKRSRSTFITKCKPPKAARPRVCQKKQKHEWQILKCLGLQYLLRCSQLFQKSLNDLKHALKATQEVELSLMVKSVVWPKDSDWAWNSVAEGKTERRTSRNWRQLR